jgi:hypothetical protein
MDGGRLYSIGDLARRTGLAVRTIRFYSDGGIVAPAGRSPAGLADRKRPFSLLRLTGARLATLRRVVAFEGAVPLLAVAVVAIGTGFGGAAMNAALQQGHPIVAPGAIAATFALLARITGPEAARNE